MHPTLGPLSLLILLLLLLEDSKLGFLELLLVESDVHRLLNLPLLKSKSARFLVDLGHHLNCWLLAIPHLQSESQRTLASTIVGLMRRERLTGEGAPKEYLRRRVLLLDAGLLFL